MQVCKCRFAVTFRRSALLSEDLNAEGHLPGCLEPTVKLPPLEGSQLPLNNADYVLFKSARRSLRTVGEQRSRLTTIRERRLERLAPEVSKYNSPEWINTAYGTRISDIRRRQGKKTFTLKHCLWSVWSHASYIIMYVTVVLYLWMCVVSRSV